MTARPSLIVLGMMGRMPMAGVVWQVLQYLEGFRRLGFSVSYVEDTGEWSYDPDRNTITDDPTYAVESIRSVMARHGFADRWAYRVADGRVFGRSASALEELFERADVLVNLTGATVLRAEHLRVPVRIYLETDPVLPQIEVAREIPFYVELLSAHTHHFTYGENLGQPDCPIPLEKFAWRPTRPPVLLDLWETPFDPRSERFTTVATWKNVGKDITFRGETYYWSKHVNILRVADLPQRTYQPLEMALQAEDPEALEMLTRNGWILTDAFEVSRTLTAYQRHIQQSRGEFTASKDLVVRTRSGWFSDRSVCYLAAGKPVVTQDTGFGNHLPTGVGLLPFGTVEEAAAALDEVNRDYRRHCRAARQIAEEHFAADRVLDQLCRDADL